MDTPTNNSYVYHAVYVPEKDDKSDGTRLHVYQDKLEALQIIKQIKSSRLKSFKTLAEAKEFALNGLESVLSNPLANSVSLIQASEGKSSKFKSLPPQALTKFRKLIEKGEYDLVKDTVWENPRYLIGSGDTPTILQEGCRYNALHVAVKATRGREMCELVLNTVGNPEFVKLYYGDTNVDETYVDRASILQDLYLNTPDKGLNETPLHFATKFGLKDCVQILLSYPLCLKNSLNKYSQTPADVICTRKFMDNKNLINEIRSLLEEQYYVPVMRAEDNTVMPIIGEPFSLTSPPASRIDPISPKIEIKAFAGPMSKEQALEFRKKWKTPPRTLGTPNKMNMSGDCNGLRSPALNVSLRLQDTEKGLERVGRELASEFHVSWKEYWPFLKDFTDLRCLEGLDKLEQFLKNKSEKNNLAIFEKSFQKLLEETSPINETQLDDICSQFQLMVLDSETNSDPETEDNFEFATPPSSPSIAKKNNEDDSSDDEMDLADDSINEEIFLEGKSPSKIDFAVFTAIPPTVDVNKHPYTYRWRHEMQLASKKIRSDTCPRTPKNLAIRKKLFLEET